MNGLLFPGQGSQTVGMGKDIYEKFESARAILNAANDILGYDIKKLMFEGPDKELTDTRHAQPAIYICSAMYMEIVKANGLEFDFVAGHSLGEYSALAAAGVFSFEDGLKLVSRRGEVMGSENGKGTMAAVIGMTEEELSPLLLEDTVIANLNSKTQIVISGKEAAINQLAAKLDQSETVSVKKLKVSAPFHSPYMKNAAAVMEEEIKRIEFHEPRCQVVSNVSGEPTMNLQCIRENLIAQITGQVRWYDSILAMKKAGVSRLYEVGYGEVLKKLNKTITFKPKCISIEV